MWSFKFPNNNDWGPETLNYNQAKSLYTWDFHDFDSYVIFTEKERLPVKVYRMGSLFLVTIKYGGGKNSVSSADIRIVIREGIIIYFRKNSLILWEWKSGVNIIRNG